MIAGLLVAGIAVAVARGSRTTPPQAIPTTSPTGTDTAFASETPAATESPAATGSPEPSVTMTFSGLPPFEQSGTPSPSPSTSKLPHTGSDDGGLLAGAVILLLTALGAAAVLARAD